MNKEEIIENLNRIKKEVETGDRRLVAVSKTKPPEAVQTAYDAGHRIFGENKVQELCDKHERLPKDIEWHMIGHLQRNKVKYIAPFVSLIHGVDSPRLLRKIEQEAQKAGRIINVLLQIRIAREETKFGLPAEEALALLANQETKALKHTRIVGLMGMATNTDDAAQVEREFALLNDLFLQCQKEFQTEAYDFKELSMGMSSDWPLAAKHGATLVRIGSAIFGARSYAG